MGRFSFLNILKRLRPRRKTIWDRLSTPLTKTELQERLSKILKKNVLVIDERADLLHRDIRQADVLVWLDFQGKDRVLIDDLFEMLSQEPNSPLCLHLKNRRDMRLLLSTAKERGEIPQKVLAYVVRPQDGHRYLLIQKKRDQESLEVIRGTVEPGETPEHSLLREIEEESGLHLQDPHRFHFESVVVRDKSSLEFQIHHCYFLEAPEEPLESWSYEGRGQGSDRGTCFKYDWLPLKKAGSALCREMREPIGSLRSYLRQSRETMSLAPRLNVK